MTAPPCVNADGKTTIPAFQAGAAGRRPARVADALPPPEFPHDQRRGRFLPVGENLRLASRPLSS